MVGRIEERLEASKPRRWRQRDVQRLGAAARTRRYYEDLDRNHRASESCEVFVSDHASDGDGSKEAETSESAPLGRPFQGSSERSVLVGPGLSRGAGEECRDERSAGMELRHLRRRRRARDRLEGAGRGWQEGCLGMAETKPLTAYAMHEVLRISQPLVMGSTHGGWCSTETHRVATSLTRRRESGSSSKPPPSSSTTSGDASTSGSNTGVRPEPGRATTSTTGSTGDCRAHCASSTRRVRGPTHRPMRRPRSNGRRRHREPGGASAVNGRDGAPAVRVLPCPTRRIPRPWFEWQDGRASMLTRRKRKRQRLGRHGEVMTPANDETVRGCCGMRHDNGMSDECC